MNKSLAIITSVLCLLIVGCIQPAPAKKFAFTDGKLNLQPVLDELAKENLIQKKTREEIPPFIQSYLDSLWGKSSEGKFLIANPGELWQSSCSPPEILDYSRVKMLIDAKTGDTSYTSPLVDTIIPNKQLKYFAIGKNKALLKYNVGGIGQFGYVVIFLFDENGVTDSWGGYGNSADTSKVEILNTLINKREEWSLRNEVF